MKTLTVEEASPGLSGLVDLALAGEQIQIRKGDAVVELRPASISQPTQLPISPLEALRLMQENATLTEKQVEDRLREIREARIASELHRAT